MKGTPRKSSRGNDIVAQWDGRDFLGRLQLVKENMDLFWSLGLISRGEIEMILSMPESEVEYIETREDHPRFLTTIDLNEKLRTQIHRDKLKAALNAVFLKPSEKKAA